MSRRIAFWITSEDLFSSQPSAIQAMDATMNIANRSRMCLRPCRLFFVFSS